MLLLLSRGVCSFWKDTFQVEFSGVKDGNSKASSCHVEHSGKENISLCTNSHKQGSIIKANAIPLAFFSFSFLSFSYSFFCLARCSNKAGKNEEKKKTYISTRLKLKTVIEIMQRSRVEL